MTKAMTDFIRQELDNLPNFLKVLEAHELRVPNAKTAVDRAVAYFRGKRAVVIHKETNNRYLVMPEDLDPITFVTDRSTTWDDVKAVEVLKR